MRGVLRPCRHQLGPELHERWRSHLCGGCLALRDHAGQAERAVTGYDTLLVSVLVEAQAGPLATTTAGPCPLRGFRPATVISSAAPATRAVAAIGLLGASAALTDKAGDGDLPTGLGRPARRVAGSLATKGRHLSEAVGFDPLAVLDAPARAAAAEARATDLDGLLAASGEAAAAVFAHCAVLAGRPGNGAALAAAGDAFGRLQHLADAIDDLDADRKAGKFNPLTATATSPAAARRLASDLVVALRSRLDEATWDDRSLLDALIDSLDRRFHPRAKARPVTTGVLATGVAAMLSLGYRRRRSCCGSCCEDCAIDAACEGCCDCCDCCDCSC